MRVAIAKLLVTLLLAAVGQAAGALEVVVYGASGKLGGPIVDEALDRGHRVTAVSRDPSKITLSAPGLDVVKGDLLDADSVAGIVAGKDVIIVSVRGVIGKSGSPTSALQFMAAETLIDALYRIEAPIPRLIHIGGAGSLEVEPGVLFAEKLPKVILPKGLEVEILGQILALEFLQKVDDVNWTYITPPKSFTNGPRTGAYRVGGDAALEDDRGRTRVSRKDFAVAVVDEAENGSYPRQRISIAY